MAQQPIELILVRHLASRLAVPVFVIDAEGDLIYFNEPAEAVLGRSFSDISIMPFSEWTTSFAPSLDGRPLQAEELPLVQALRQAAPAHQRLEIVSGDDVSRSIEVTAFPVITPSQQILGAVAMFWEPSDG